MKIVQHILDRKGNEIWTIPPHSTVFEALKIMAEKEIGALLVQDKEKVVGIISERDYARKVVLKGKSSKDAPVKDIMSEKVIYVKPSTSVEDCMVLMINKRIRHLPVFDNERLVGLVSIGDVVKEIIDEKEVVIDELVRYITGRR
ncbi:MAG: CBS domain-containing protein [Ignavibacteria bacterium]|jgi:CBS domain-containing protein